MFFIYKYHMKICHFFAKKLRFTRSHFLRPQHQSAHQFNIDVHSNIITIMHIFKQFCVGNVHAIGVQYSQNTIEASVTFNQKYIQYYKQTSAFKHKPILIPDTNVLLLII